MNRLTYTIKAYALLAKRIVKGQDMPFHSRKCRSVAEYVALPEKYRRNGIWMTAKAIAKGECRLHWLRG